MINSELVSHRLGAAALAPPGPVVAGSVGQWILTYTVGSYGIDEGGAIKLAQRFASDWEIPQFDRPAGPGYTTVTTTGRASLRPYYHKKAHERPWMNCLVIDVYDGNLAPGDTVTIILGNRSQGSPGIRAQTFQESAHEFRVLVDPTNASLARPLPTSPTFAVIPDVPAELVCLLPTQAVIGQPVEIFVKGQDRWGNPTPAPEGLELAWEGQARVEIEGRRLILLTPGSGQVACAAQHGQTQLACRSNPITAFEEEPALKKYWGDLHAQTAATVGTGTEEEYFTFGRDVARLDFMSHQGNDFQMTDAYWQHLNDTVRRFQQDGRFVVFPGYEWSANTTAGGDRNVFYRLEGRPIFRSSHWQIPEIPEDDLTPAHPADVLFERIRRHVDPDQVLLAAHVGGRYADINRYFDQELGPLVEVVSCWGVFEWLLLDALDNGYRVGVMGNSDGHKGRPGAEGPGAGEFGIGNGLTCVLAESLTREAIFAALKARRCYGTTGPRIDLSFDLAGQPMGADVGWQPEARVSARARCTAPYEALMLFRGRELVHIVRPAAFPPDPDCRRVRVSWRGARMRGRGRRVSWDGVLRMNGAAIVSAAPFAFDALTDGIVAQDRHSVTFRSQTTGDTDGLDLFLEQATEGSIIFDSQAGRYEVDLGELTGAGGKKLFDLGGLDMQLCFERYPEKLTEREVFLACDVAPPAGETSAYYVKLVQTDGHMAWSSPVYVG